jgi:hypothetical protein
MFSGTVSGPRFANCTWTSPRFSAALWRTTRPHATAASRAFERGHHARGCVTSIVWNTGLSTFHAVAGKDDPRAAAGDRTPLGGQRRRAGRSGSAVGENRDRALPRPDAARKKLIAAGPSPLEAVAVPGVDRDKLAYFGVSVFWRAAVHRWHLPSADPGPIQLGPYEAPIRRYLLGETNFPKDVVLLVSVAHSTEEMKNKFVTSPWCFKREGGHHQFKLIVPGITFQMCVGKIMQPGLRNMCTARSPEGFIYMSSRTDDINVQGNLAMLKTAKRVGKSVRVCHRVANAADLHRSFAPPTKK